MDPVASKEVQMTNIVSMAWNDAAFKERLLADPMATLKAEGVSIPKGLEIRVVENTDSLFNLVIPARPQASNDAFLHLDSSDESNTCCKINNGSREFHW